jgi:hypothetical protein
MTAEGWIFTVQGSDTKYGHDGTDAMIITVPPTWYAEVEGGRAVLARVAGAGLREASEQGAARVGRRLHHADWQLTGDPAVVRDVMPQHCPECAAGTEAALAYLAEQPGREVALGLLYFAAEKAPAGSAGGGG